MRRVGRIGRLLRRSTGSVRLRVTALATGLFAVALGVASWTLLDVLEHRLVGDLRSSAQDVLRTEAGRIVADALPLEVPDGAIALSDGGGVAFRIPSGSATPIVAIASGTGVSGGGVGTAGTGATSSGDVVVAPDGTADASTSFSVTFTGPMDAASSSPALYGMADVAGPFIVSTVQVGDGVALSTASSLATVDRTLDATRSILWVVVPLLVLLVAVLSWWLVSRALRPVRLLTSGAASITSESLSERLPVPPSHDEVAELATTMNSMLERLERATTTSRRLVSDASHELRTPITVMRAELEVAQRDGDVRWDDVSTRVLGEVDRLQLLVDDLMLLARLGERGVAVGRVSLLDLAHDASARRRSVPVTVAVVVTEPVGDGAGPGGGDVDAEIDGDAVALGRAVDHLVANAARHAAARVQVSIEHLGGTMALHVDDDGPGIPEDDRERVTQRFVRLDEGRSRDVGGSGLGLAVASEVAAAHDGSLAIGTSPLGGARVSLVLPAPVLSRR